MTEVKLTSSRAHYSGKFVKQEGLQQAGHRVGAWEAMAS
jgi:hypothetical protein